MTRLASSRTAGRSDIALLGDDVRRPLSGERLSVAMVTFNGARYVGEQLASIASQTRLPDELVVCDDGSTDGTAAIIENLIRQLPFPARVHIGAHVGARKNLEAAIGMCSGDLIALSDQDDVWLPDKLALSEETLVAAPKAGVVFADAIVVGEKLDPLGYTLWESIAFGPRQKRLVREGQAFGMLLRRDAVQGATMVFRSRFKEIILPIPSEGLRKPDGWVALAVASVAELVYVDRPLILYRQHPGQYVGARPPGVSRESTVSYDSNRVAASFRSQGAADCTELHRRLSRASAAYTDAATAARICQSRARHLEARARLSERWRVRVPLVLREIVAGRYHRHSRGILSATKDAVGTPHV